MAGIGITENKIYPRNKAFGQFQPFTVQDVQSQPHNFGGAGPSRMKSESEMEKRRFKTQERLTLDDVRWSDMRKKVPLMGRVPQSKIMEMEDDESFQKQKIEHIAYITQHFKQLECQRFVPAVNQPNVEKLENLKCHCGEVLKGHVPSSITPAGKRNFATLIPSELNEGDFQFDVNNLQAKPKGDYSKIAWNASDALREQHTTSFGKIKFTGVEQVGGMKPAKYLRLKDVESPDVVDSVIYLMKEHWRIMEPKTPSLIISVVGGAKNFKLSGKMRETFQSGLIKASKTTNAWLITSGFNMGCMKEVGLAVREGQSFEWYKDRFAHVLRCIGIAPWGYVKNRHVLTDNSRQAMGKFDKIAEYKTSNTIEHLKPVPLNPDHTHFLFVDNGLRNQYKGVAEFRARFEKKLSDPVDKGGLGIPVVLIVLEGGRDAIEDAKTSLGQNIPVILCEGTGRAADILVTAYNVGDIESKNFRSKVRKAIKKAYFELKPADKENPKAIKKAQDGIESVFNSVKKCMQKKYLISIFHINKHEELDNEILKILLKAKTGEVSEMQRLERLKLALKWNRPDIAQEEIFREDALWSRGSFDEALKTAIMNDNVKFVQIILNQGVVMREYLTEKRLMDLYNTAITDKDINNMPLKKVMSRMGIQTIDRERLIRVVVALMDKYEFDMVEDAQEQEVELDEVPIEPGQFKFPYKHLLIWSVLLLRQNMAHFAVKMGGEPVTSSVAASRLNYSLATYIHRNEQAVKNKVLQYKTEFDDLASEVIDECHQRDPNKAMMIAERRSPIWSNMTSMQMAASADNQTYLASVVCQNSISTIWKRGISSSWQRVFFVSILPFMACTPLLEIDKLGDQRISPCQKFLTFLTSPIAKFTYHSMMYLAFLILFTYFVLVEFKKDAITPIETVCIIWILTVIVDNIHTCLAFPSPTLKGTIRDWFGLLKFLDQFNCVLAICAFIIHWEGTYYRQAKAIFCINTVVFYIRVLEVYTVNSRLGPKMVMIKRMMLELVMFILVLLIFLLAYGVVSQGLLYLERKPSWQILKDVIYYPYWQFYGELFLEEIDTDSDCLANVANISSPASVDMCRSFHWLVPIFLGVYLLIGNVLLLNLLIAIFSNVFQEVEVNSNRIWKYQMYLLVMEFDTKAALVPPLSIFIHIYLIFKWIFRRTCCRKSKGRQYGSRHLEYLQLFEKEQLSNYLRKKKTDERSATDINILAMQKRVDELYNMVKEDMLEEEQLEEKEKTNNGGLDREDTLYSRPETAKPTDQSAATKDEASDKEEKKEKKHKKKKKKKSKSRDHVEKEINIDNDLQKPEMEKKVPTWVSDPHMETVDGLPPPGTPMSSRRKPTLPTWNSDSDSDDNRQPPPMLFNIRHDSDQSDLNNFDRKHRHQRSKSQPQDSEEELHRRSSKIRQKLRKKRSSNRNDSDSL